AVAIVWRYLYHPRYGLLNAALGAVGIGPVDWLGDPRWAMPAIILLAVWRNFGYNMLIFVAGLQRIPAQLYEAAELDGAGAWARFRYITLPQLAPTFVFVGAVTLVPLVWMVSASLMPTGQATTYPPRFFPRAVTFEHYAELFTRLSLGRYVLNSSIVALAATLLSLLFNSMAGYALAKL